ncbi:MAG: alpha/beta hydrolase [Myxococcales bacterium]|nr:alpha/beta hydrolase [Myxococcales bacterium]
MNRAVTRWAYNNLLIGNIERLARGLRHAPSMRPERFGITIDRDIAYGSLPEHKLDIYRTTALSTPAPVVVYIHGGGFRFFDKETHWAMASRFAREGYLVFNLDYRLAPHHTYPAPVEDVAEALRWVVRHAPAMGGDLDRLVLAGESAGANLATGLAISCAWRREESWAQKVWELNVQPRVLAPACGYLQVSQPGRHADSHPIPPWMASRIHAVSDNYLPTHAQPTAAHAYANPLAILEAASAPERRFPATFAIGGGDDPVRTDTERLGDALGKLSVPHQIEMYEGGGHTFHALMFTDLARRAWDDKLAFVARHLAS